ncbi:hypothetical protein RB594_008436 [Gaeumannomyces avenae]
MPGNGGQPRASPDDDPSAGAADQARRLRPAPQLPSPSASLSPKSDGGAAVGAGYGGGDTPVEVVNELQKQPETRPVTQEQLIAEVKGICSGLAMLESRCIKAVTTEASLHDNPNSPPPTNDQWQALVSLHEKLLDEHHDFFLASQRPDAGPALRRLAPKYAMPRRIWQLGIHNFLELLKHRLPGSSEYMSRFIHYAYSIITLLYEIAPAFKDTWIECLGDLSRYIEEELGHLLPDADTMGVAGGTSKDEQSEFPSLDDLQNDNLRSDETLPDANVTGVDSVNRIGNDISLQPNNSTQDIPDKGSF